MVKFAHLIIAILICAAIAFSQPDEKMRQAQAAFLDAAKTAVPGTEESWNAAVPKFEEALRFLFEHFGPEKKDAAVRDFVNAMRSLGAQLIEAKSFHAANRYFTYALSKAREARLHRETGILIEDLGNSAVIEGRGSEAREFYRQALVIFLEINEPLRIGVVYRQLGLIASDSGDYKEAVTNLEQSLKFVRVAKHRVVEAQVLSYLGDAYYDIDSFAKAEPLLREANNIYVELKDEPGIQRTNVLLGKVLYFLYRSEEAVKLLVPAVGYYEAANDKENLAEALIKLGKAYVVLASYDEGRKALERSAKLFGELGLIIREADAYMNIGNLDLHNGQYEAAKARFHVALDRFTAANARRGPMLANIALAEAYSYGNENAKALDFARAALAIAEKDGMKDGLFGAYRIIGWLNIVSSQYAEALANTRAALKLAEEMDDPRRQSDALINIGIIYSFLGMKQDAIEQYRRAFELTKRSNDKYTAAILLSNIGYNHFGLDDHENARKYLEDAIARMRELNLKRELGYAIHNLAMVKFAIGDHDGAQTGYREALAIYLQVNERRPEAYAYMSLGEVDAARKQWDKAVANFEKAIQISREIGYTAIEANTLAAMMDLWKQRAKPRLAVLYGKQAVNLLQAVRLQNRALEKTSLASFVKHNEDIYRELADILASQGRLPEAQQVLDLLKEEEYFEFVRRDAAEASDQAKLSLTAAEKAALEEYTRLSNRLTALGARFQALQDARAKAGGKLPAEQETEYQTLKTQIESAGVGIRTFLAKLADEFSKKVEDQATITPQSIESLRADLRSVGPDVVLVSTYLLPKRYRAIVTTGRAMVDRKVEYSDRKLTADDINRKIAEFQRALQNPRVDPRPLGKELYDVFVKPLEGDLKGAGAKTILWSLDGSLRYIPMAALSPDGKTYLAEHYQNVIVTLARQSKLFDPPTGAEWRALGAGVSKPHEGFSALPSVVNELNAIVQDKDSNGVLAGKKLLDESFDLDSFRDSVPQLDVDGKPFNVVHLATHFKLGVNDQDSALLLGDGKRLSLFEIGKDEDIDFRNVDLLALSACETGISAGDGSGKEVESLGMLAQRKGARSILATLWKVADEGTSLFMAEFYKLKKMNAQMSKAEAIRLTQKAMIDGKIKATGHGGGCRSELFTGGGKETEFKCDPNAPFSHPYFWSPFVLIGNWR